MNCMWCETEDIRESVKDCYWIMPDGRDGGTNFGRPRNRMRRTAVLMYSKAPRSKLKRPYIGMMCPRLEPRFAMKI